MDNDGTKWYEKLEILIILVSMVYICGLIYKKYGEWTIPVIIVWIIILYRIMTKKGMWGK